jgi:N-acetylmuramic acid 6-phosphate etherase
MSVPDFGQLTTEGVRDGIRPLDTLPTDTLVDMMAADLDSVQRALRQAVPQIATAIDEISDRMAGGGRLIYIGAGTSGRLAMLDAAECIPTFDARPGQVIALIAGGDRATSTAVEDAEDDEADAARQIAVVGVTVRDVVIGISASGYTPFVLAGVRAARAAGAMTIGAACNDGTPLAAEADLAIELPVGEELLAGSTRLKAGTAQKVLLNAISTISMMRLGKTFGNLMVDVRPTNAKLLARAVRIVRLVTGASEVAAADAMAATGNDTKAAIVLLMRSTSASEATELLVASAGRLREVLQEDPTDTTLQATTEGAE